MQTKFPAAPGPFLKMIKTGEDNVRSLPPYPQTVEFSGSEDQNSVELYSYDVTVIPSSGGHDHGSSKVKLKNIVDFTWEHHFYTGQLLAVHMSGKYLAYGIKAGTGAGVVRVVYKEREQRALLRGMRGTIQDLAFAHIPNAVLACVDYSGSLFVHTIESTPSELVCTLVLQVDADDTTPMSHRVIWCPYLPDDESPDDDEVSKHLVVTRGSKVELWSVATVSSRLGAGPFKLTDPALKKCGGIQEISQHSGTIVEASISPDGTAIATASLDGEVKFFQIFIMDSVIGIKPRCLHQWKPHDGRPISSLFFLDDHKNYNPEVQFWRFAVTGCNQNSEIKVWSCEVWTCLQTIKFAPNPNTGKTPVLKAGLDSSAGYLLLSDIYNKVLYILSISKGNSEMVACVSTISEFLLPYPILSFGIVDAGQRKIRPAGESLEDLCPIEDENEDQLVIRMYLVQPKSLQECHIAFRPATQINDSCLMDTLTHDSLDYAEDLPEIRAVNHNGITDENGEENRSLSATIEAASNHNTALNLMTPDAFSSPAKKDSSAMESNTPSPELGTVLSASPSLAQAVQALNVSDPPLATSEIEEQAPASGGSSPSREVREILSLAEPEQEIEIESETKSEGKNPVGGEDWPMVPMVLLKDVYEKEMTGDFNKEPEQEEIAKEEMAKKPEVDNSWRVSEIEGLNSKLDSIHENVEYQRTELRELRGQLNRLTQETLIETAVIRAAVERQGSSLDQTLCNHMARQQDFLNSLDVTIKEKIENVLPRAIDNVVDPLKHQLRLDVTRVDELLKENITKIVTGSHVKDAVALAAANAAKPALDAAFKDAFTNVLLPGMEKACQTIFKQVQDAFVKGTREYLQSVEAVAEKQFQRHNDQLSEALANLVREELQTEMNRGLTTIQEGTVRTVRDSIRENLNQQLTEISGVRSRATTPGIPGVPVAADVQARVMSLLQRGQHNAAFQQALSASDLGLVVLVCERTEPSRVFSCQIAQGQSPRCILQQPVILSLVQQLSADLLHRTELKHRWLEEAILSLDPTDPVTREHMGTVLLTLQNQLAAFLSANPTHRSAKGMKMLAMATSALLNRHS